MKTTYLRISILAVSLVAVVACGKKKADEPVRVGAGTVTAAPFVAGPPNLPMNQNVVPGSAIPVTAVAGTSITDVVKILMSPVVPAEEIGSVSSVMIQGDISVDRTNGQVIPSPNQGILIVITDSNVGAPSSNSPTGRIEPMPIRLAPNSGGISNGNVNLIFRDNTGEIRIQGTYDTSVFRGSISFTNNQVGYQNQREGTLGTFQTATCNFFRCN
jgi:hypothetical protein